MSSLIPVDSPSKDGDIVSRRDKGIFHCPISEWSEARKGMVEKCSKLGIEKVGDLCTHFPVGWEDRTKVVSISALVVGQPQQVEGRILSVALGRSARPMFVTIEDDSGARLKLMFFRFTRDQYHRMKNAGGSLLCYGTANLSSRNELTMSHPQYRHLSQPGTGLDTHLNPVYRLTEGLRQWELRRLIASALKALREGDALADPLAPIIEKAWPENMAHDLIESIEKLHRVPAGIDIADVNSFLDPYSNRLALDELVANYVVRLRSRWQASQSKARALQADEQQVQDFVQTLPFQLTPAQLRVTAELRHDMQGIKPMMRLLQGDVGSGKTVVAAIVALHAISAGVQVALLAPTEVLMEQHEQNFRQWLEPLGMRMAILSSSTTAARRRTVLKSLASGEIQLCLGTHAILEPDVIFADLGLMIVDEQHRFGVRQRLQLAEKARGDDSSAPHQLTMTATPIPRTLAMTLYADMDVSTIDEMPAERMGTTTALVEQARREQVLSRLAQRCRQGARAYWICTLVEQSENFSAADAIGVAKDLQAGLPDVSVGLLHGRMKAEEKQQAMQDFKSGKVQLLVATTVVEVGVDVPEANFMIIENPERFGLAQLHQLRGRIGRGSEPGYCVLLVDDDLPAPALERLKVLSTTQSGFEIAEKDLRMRGAGEFLGTRQHGGVSFRTIDFERHAHLFSLARTIGKQLADSDPEGADLLIERWFGGRSRYVDA